MIMTEDEKRDEWPNLEVMEEYVVEELEEMEREKDNEREIDQVVQSVNFGKDVIHDCKTQNRLTNILHHDHQYQHYPRKHLMKLLLMKIPHLLTITRSMRLNHWIRFTIHSESDLHQPNRGRNQKTRSLPS